MSIKPLESSAMTLPQIVVSCNSILVERCFGVTIDDMYFKGILRSKNEFNFLVLPEEDILC